jgi:hypothetical protein
VTLFPGQQPVMPGMDDPMADYAALGVLGKLLDLSDREIQNLAKDGVIPPSINGKYHVFDSARGYIRKLRDAAAGRAKSTDREDLEMRKLKAETEQEEISARKMKGEVAELEAIRREWENLLVSFKTRCRLIPRKSARRAVDLFLNAYSAHLQEETPDNLQQGVVIEVENVLGIEIDEALVELSRYDPEGNGAEPETAEQQIEIPVEEEKERENIQKEEKCIEMQ